MEKKLRILQVHNAYQIPGGEDVVVANEKKLLEMNGNDERVPEASDPVYGSVFFQNVPGGEEAHPGK